MHAAAEEHFSGKEKSMGKKFAAWTRVEAVLRSFAV